MSKLPPPGGARPPLEVVRNTSSPRAELVPRSDDPGLLMVCAPAEAQRRLQEMRAFVEANMKPDVDFGIIPGTGDKPTLLQPGAQKLAEFYGLAHRFLAGDTVKDWERGFFYFEWKCLLTSRRDGSFVGEGLGSCNSREKKYGARWVGQKYVPSHLRLADLPSKEVSGKYGPFIAYQVPNEDPFSLINTMQKMAAKRAYVHAVVSVTRASCLFTQDVEDLPPEAFGVVSEERPWERERAPQAAAPVEVEAPTPPSPPPPVVRRDVKPANVTPAVPVGAPPLSATESKARRELAPALERATTLGEYEALRQEALLAAAVDPANPHQRKPTPRYLAWYESAFGDALARIGGVA